MELASLYTVTSSVLQEIIHCKRPVLFYLSLITSVATGKQLKTSRFPRSFLYKVSWRLGSMFIDVTQTLFEAFREHFNW